MGGGYLQSTSRASQCQSGVLARVSRLKFEVELNYCCWFVNPRTRAVTSPKHSLALGDIYLNTRVISASHISHGITAPGNGCKEIKSTYTSVFKVFLHENIYNISSHEKDVHIMLIIMTLRYIITEDETLFIVLTLVIGHLLSPFLLHLFTYLLSLCPA